MSWAIERETVASGEAEPIDSRSEDSVVSIMHARYLLLAVGVRLRGVRVRLRKVRGEDSAISRQRRLRFPGC